MCQLEKRGANEITELLVTVTFQVHMIEPWSTIRKTKRKQRPSSEQKQTKENAAARVQGGARFSRVQQRTKRKEKTYFHKTKTNRGEKCRSIVSKMQGGIHFVQ